MKPVTGPLTAAFDHAVIPFEMPTLAELKKSLIGKTGMQKKERDWQVKQMTGDEPKRFEDYPSSSKGRLFKVMKAIYRRLRTS